jgi:hypothetical protein
VRSRNGWDLRLAHVIPAPGGRVIDRAAIAGGLIDDSLGSRASGLFRRASSEVACVTSMAIMGLHTLELPPGSSDETSQMISMELDAAGESMPREFDSFECKGLSATESGLTSRTVLSLPNFVGEAIADSLRQLRLQCQAIDSLPCAHARAVNLIGPTPTGGLSGALDWGAIAPTFTLIRDGAPIYCRQLRDCGLRAIVGRAAASHGLAEAELHELMTMNVRTETSQAAGASRWLGILREISAAAARSLADEVARTLTYLRRQASNLIPETIWLMGGGALLPDVAPQLTTMLDRPVRLWQLNTRPSSGRTDVDPIQAVFAPAIAASSLGVRS